MTGDAQCAASLAEQLVVELSRRRETLAFCESLTAGLAAATVASVPGASAVLLGGLVTYATRLKHDLAGVSEGVLAEFGPVAKPTALAMAAGVKQRTGADWALSLTGVAGPAEQDGHKVGEVWLGVADPSGELRARLAGHPLLPGTRQEIRQRAVVAALALCLEEVRKLR